MTTTKFCFWVYILVKEIQSLVNMESNSVYFSQTTFPTDKRWEFIVNQVRKIIKANIEEL